MNIADLPAIAAREAVPAHRLPGVYLLFNGDVVQYVGMSRNPLKRVAGHAKRAAIPFDRYWIHPCASVDDARALEAHMIVLLDPPSNVLLKPKPKPEPRPKREPAVRVLSIRARRHPARVARGIRMDASLWAFIDATAAREGATCSALLEKWVREKIAAVREAA